MGFRFIVRPADNNDVNHIIKLLFPTSSISTSSQTEKAVKELLDNSRFSNNVKSLYIVTDLSEKIYGVYSLRVLRNLNEQSFMFIDDVGIHPKANKDWVIECMIREANKKAIAAKCQRLIPLTDKISDSLLKEICQTSDQTRLAPSNFFLKPMRTANQTTLPLQELVRGMTMSKL